ncbi:biotin holocarboxylase synthetase [Stygiomarasmius scandens]|uniref:Biotin holocarboxylase synthetase n=1 Tax=Marasmiellus scandens TaxID=2682957 RepID=A0ABR1IT57_9AGAR
MEKTAAAIMCKFEKMWHTFVEGRGSFAPFIDLYLERWLHSDQLVLLTTFNPPKSVRICGITLDHGLLRTLPERAGWPSEDNSFIDLQPDGNSFDLMAGLIKTKS